MTTQSAPSTPKHHSAEQRKRIEALATVLHDQYVQPTDQAPLAGIVLRQWTNTAERILTKAGITNLERPVSLSQVTRFASGVYDKMTESSGRFDTSSQRGAWVRFSTRALASAGFAVETTEKGTPR